MTFRHSKRTFKGVPLMVANMDSVGTFEMAVALAKHGVFTAVHKYYTVVDWKNFAVDHPNCLDYVAVCTGITEEDNRRLSSILQAVPEISYIVADVANGYSQYFVESVKNLREEYPNHTIIAGNVCTREMVEELILSGADIVKVGIGGGSVCTTRLKAGVGYPQLSCVIECADAAHGLNGHIISDGGCTCSGDIAKAFGAGADFVMIGGLMAGHDECHGELTEKDGKMVKLFYGNSSRISMEKRFGGVAKYRAVEGKSVDITYRGSVEHTLFDIFGGLRSACTYVGAERLKELPRRATFIRCSQQTNNIFGPPV
ncbi:GMP reductase 1-like isoform X2 [Leptopilina heterotoma]|nr:GMP reductase 1-like isoform X2 [Leptopilina heterotoma]